MDKRIVKSGRDIEKKRIRYQQMKICPECCAEYQNTPKLREQGCFNVKYIYNFECAECHTVWEVEHSAERKPLKPMIKAAFMWLLNPITVFIVSSLVVIFVDIYGNSDGGIDVMPILLSVGGSIVIWGLLFGEI